MLFIVAPSSAGIFLVGGVAAAYSQNFPVKPVRIVVGPGSDVLMRLVGQKLTGMWGQQIVIDQRPGGGGTTP